MYPYFLQRIFIHARQYRHGQYLRPYYAESVGLRAYGLCGLFHHVVSAEGMDIEHERPEPRYRHGGF